MAQVVSRQHRLDLAIKLVKKHLKPWLKYADRHTIITDTGVAEVRLWEDAEFVDEPLTGVAVWFVSPERKLARVLGPRGTEEITLCP